jgi:hypothetical protein
MLESGLVALIAQLLPDYPARIYPNVPALNAPMPNISYQQISKTGDPTLDGSCRLQEIRMQFEFRSIYDSQGLGPARELADSLRLAIDGFAGMLPNGVCVNSILFGDENVFFDDTARMHRIVQDYFIWYYLTIKEHI